jgi:hypothetical protein
MLLSPEKHGRMVFHILANEYHKPFVDGKCNRENIEEQIIIGAYKGEIPPINNDDVEMICDLVDELIEEYGR